MATPAEFDVSIEARSPDVLVVRIAGELDLATSPHVESAIASASAPSLVVFDLTDCTFLDSSGVHLLLATYRRVTASGGRVELVAVDQGILRVLEITGVTTTMAVHPNVETAL